MKTTLFLPPIFKYIGIVLLAFFLIDGFFELSFFNKVDFYLKVPVLFKSGDKSDGIPPVIFGFSQENIGFTIRLAITNLGSFFILFSKEKVEDEFVNTLRLTCLLRALFIYYLVGFILIIGVYGSIFINIYFDYLYLIPIFYTINFHFLLYKNGYFSKKNEE